jgi:hypothetical protein
MELIHVRGEHDLVIALRDREIRGLHLNPDETAG